MNIDSVQVVRISIRARPAESATDGEPGGPRHPAAGSPVARPRRSRQPRLEDALAMGELVRAAGGRLRLGGSTGAPEFVIVLPRVSEPVIRQLDWQPSAGPG